MQTESIEFKSKKPAKPLADFVDSYWMLANHSGKDHKIIILPDGRVDIIFSLANNNSVEANLKGLDTEPGQAIIPANTSLFSISFKLLAIEYLLNEKIDSLHNEGVQLPTGFWGINKEDIKDFDNFCEKISVKISSCISLKIDNRKQELFNLIYSSTGSLSVKELSEKVFWSSRQINRYFNQTFGVSLKSYCNILRFKSSLYHIKKGKLFPGLNYADQTHFIREVKKMSGVTPKELSKNENDRFILFSTLTEE